MSKRPAGTASDDDPAIVESEIPALVALIRKMVGIDRKYSVDEAGAIQEIAEEVGAKVFWDHMNASYRNEPSAEDTWRLARGVERKKAQQTLLSLLRKLSTSDGIDPRELELFEQLGSLWKL